MTTSSYSREVAPRSTIRERIEHNAAQLRLRVPITSTVPGIDPVRSAARLVGAYVALTMNDVPRSDPDGSAIDIVDIFSGPGGMSAGFRAVSSLVPSYRLAFALDVDELANRTYMGNLSLKPLGGDVRLLEKDRTMFERLAGSLRPRNPLVLIGCAPCQGFSSYRKDGTGDCRNTLMAAFARLAVRLDPQFIVMENVPELLAARYWPFFLSARRILSRAGYLVRARIYNMAEFGIPQERFRAVIVASKRPFSMPTGFLDRTNFKTVRQAIGHLPAIEPGERIDGYPMHFTARHRPSTIRTIRKVPKNGGSRPFDAGPESLRRAFYRQGKEAFEDIYGRLRWDRSSITITHYSRNPASGRFVHPEQDRGLSALEAALLQGFPDRYWFEGSLDDKFRQIGDAVPPRFSAYIAAHLLGEMFSPHTPPNSPEGDVLRPVGESFSRMIAGLKNRKGRLA